MNNRSVSAIGVIFHVACCAGWALPVSADADPQLRRLFEPTAAERLAERRGEIYIYDGLDESTVAQAIDQQFGRIQNMMFVRVKYPEPEVDEVWMEDGCD